MDFTKKKKQDIQIENVGFYKKKKKKTLKKKKKKHFVQGTETSNRIDFRFFLQKNYCRWKIKF